MLSCVYKLATYINTGVKEGQNVFDLGCSPRYSIYTIPCGDSNTSYIVYILYNLSKNGEFPEGYRLCYGVSL